MKRILKRTKSDLAKEETARKAANRAADLTYKRLVLKLISHYDALAKTGEEDMGLLRLSMAGRFHAITDALGNLISDLTRDAAWPYEPWGRD